MQVTTIGVDLAKNVFQVHGIAENDVVLFNKPLRRAKFLPFFAKLDPCLIGMESCSSAHHWARELTALGHEVRLIPPMYVKPYVKRGKSDAIDAEAICEAVTRPTMRFVAIKTVEQQALLSLHRARDLLVRQRTQLINGLRGLVAEFGIYIPRGLARVIGFAEDITLGEVLDLPDIANEVIRNLSEQLMALHKRIRWYEERLKQVAKEDARVRLLRTIPGVGAVTARDLMKAAAVLEEVRRRAEVFDEVQPAGPWHPEIQHGNVRLALSERGEEFVPVRGLGNHLDVGRIAQNLSESPTDNGVVVGDSYTDHAEGGKGRGNDTETAAPRPGVPSMVSEPP